MYNFKRNKGKHLKKVAGITLIALVVTIIVLLILAGISIQMLTGDNGILTRAAAAKENTEQSQLEEQRRLASMEAATNLKETVYNDGEKEIKIPSGFAPTGIEGESTVEEGLVITDSRGNEFVWVEVPKTIYSDGNYISANNNIAVTSATDYDGIYKILNKYAEDYRHGAAIEDFNWKDEWYDSVGKKASTSSNLEDTKGCGLTNEQYTKLYTKMLTSVFENGGFWIGRYEAGIEGSDKDISKTRQSHTEITASSPKAVSNPDCVPYNWITCSEAQLLASNVSNKGAYNSSLMFGIQWDLVLKFIKEKGNLADNTLLTGNSNSLGNYRDSSFILDRGKYAIYDGSLSSTWNAYTFSTENYVESGEKKAEQSGVPNSGRVLCTTGVSDKNQNQNIYDLAANVQEWTLEYATFIKGFPCAARGGSFNDTGSIAPASNRFGLCSSASSSFGIRFPRHTLLRYYKLKLCITDQKV